MSLSHLLIFTSCADSEGVGGGGGGGQGVWTSTPEKSQNIVSLSNTGPDPLKITHLCILHSMLGHHLHVSETPFKWCFAGGPIKAGF